MQCTNFSPTGAYSRKCMLLVGPCASILGKVRPPTFLSDNSDKLHQILHKLSFLPLLFFFFFLLSAFKDHLWLPGAQSLQCKNNQKLRDTWNYIFSHTGLPCYTALLLAHEADPGWLVTIEYIMPSDAGNLYLIVDTMHRRLLITSLPCMLSHLQAPICSPFSSPSKNQY